MSIREYIQKLQYDDRLITVSKPISSKYEIAGVMKKIEPQPILFDNIEESTFKVAGNLFCTKASFAEYFNIPAAEIIPFLTSAINNPTSPKIVQTAPCQEVILEDVNLDELPILKHCNRDGGPYVTSGIFFARHHEYGQNADYHRCMQISKTEMAVRVVSSRHFDTYLKDKKTLDVAVCIGNTPNILAAAAISVDLGVDELDIANTLEPFNVVRARTVDLLIPAETEIVLEGTVFLDSLHPEGPFIDLTETMDHVRNQPTLVVKTITHRKDAIWQGLLPGGLEHKLLMGMPREPTIFSKVNQVVNCLDVNINPGGCSWLHAIIKINKQSENDGKKAIEAAFQGHRSCKHIFIVDEDIDIYNPLEVEWAMATRFQGDQDMIIKGREAGSSLDPSADPENKMTTKIGFDLTKPLGDAGIAYKKVDFPEIDIRKYIRD